MRSKILMYLFIFALLFCIFIYVNDKRILDSKQEKIEQLEDKLSEVELNQDQLSVATSEDYFNLEDNEDAITYFQKLGCCVDIETSTLHQFSKFCPWICVHVPAPALCFLLTTCHNHPQYYWEPFFDNCSGSVPDRRQDDPRRDD